MADLIYNSFYTDLGDGDIDLLGGTFKLMLVTSAYTPDIDAHNTRDDITNEVVGDGYTAGGAALPNVAWTQDNTNDMTVWTADPVSWPNSSITARRGVLYLANGGAASGDLLVKVFDFGSDQTTNNTEFKVTFNAAGILQIKTGT